MSRNARRLRPDNVSTRRQYEAHPLDPIRLDGTNDYVRRLLSYFPDDVDDFDEDDFGWQNEPFYVRPVVRYLLIDAARFK